MPQTIKSFSEATPFDARVLNDNYDDTTKPKIRTASMASTRGSQSDGSDTDTETITAPSTPPTCKAQVEALPPTPLPKMQLFIVLLIQFAEPVTATVIYPFVNQFVRETGVTGGDERRVGYYAGAVESIFFIAEALTVVHWGRASDCFGRRPVILFGPLGLCLAMLGFGLSKGFWTMAIFRCLQGVFNGNIGISKTVLAELTDSTNMADVFAMMPLMWGVGSTVGPVIGGIFSRPATRWPRLFGSMQFFRSYPYFLPCALAGLIACCSSLIAFLGLRETHPAAIARRLQAHKTRSYSRSSSPASSESSCLLSGSDGLVYGSRTNNNNLESCETLHPHSASFSSESTLFRGDDDAQGPPHSEEIMKPLPFRDLLVPDVITALTNMGFLALLDMAAQVLLPLMYSTSIPFGGLGFTPYQIGVILGTWGVINAIVQIGMMGRLIRWFGPRNVYIVSFAALVVVFGAYPVLSWLAKRAGRVDGYVWAVIVVQLAATMLTYMAYGSMHMFTVDSAPNRSALGATTGMAQSLACTARSVAPSFASSLFSISLERQLMGGNLVYYTLIAIVLIGIKTSLMLPNKLKNRAGVR